MKDRPIIFSAQMVKALLDGRKTQTRRVLKPQPHFDGRWWKVAGAAWGDGSTPTIVPCHSLVGAPAR